MADRLYSFLLLSFACLLTITSNGQDPELVIPRGHTNPVIEITASSDKKFIVSSDGTNELIILSARTGSELVRHQLSSPVLAVESVGPSAPVGLFDGTLYTFDYATRELSIAWQARFCSRTKV